jgi:two-component system sensor histidine kinase KdpD
MLPLARIAGIALERAQLVQQLLDARAAARAEEFKTSLLSSVSHDLRTPLTTIRTAASSLLEFGDVLDSDTASELLGSIVDESDRLNHLTSNLLEMSRLQGGRDGLRLSVLPAGEIMRGVLARLERSSAQARIAIVAPREEVQIEVDPVLFELALVNVVENALVYSPPQSPVRIECLVEGETCVIAVTDQGPGIPPSDQVNVFKRFYRGQAGRDARKGSGLGLAIAKGFVEASRGRITIISPVGEERGTTIRLCLPLAEQRIAA